MGNRDYNEGREAALREINADRWSHARAAAYVAECAAISPALVEGRSEFDRGFMVVVRGWAVSS